MAALDPTARSILAEGRQLHLGLLTSRGPHITPELYATVHNDLWFATAADTLKSRLLPRNGTVSGLVRAGSRSFVLRGETRLYDAANARSLLGSAGEGLRALQAIGAFTVRNAADLGGFARDLVAGRLPSRRPQRRILVRLRPLAWATLDGTALNTVGGEWPGRVEAPDLQPGLPGARDAAIAWQHEDGVIVLPGRLESPAAHVAVVHAPAVLGQLAGVEAGEAAAAVVSDDYRAPGPAAESGSMLRGRGALSYDGAVAHIELVVERETSWDGAATRTEERPAS
jgi:hypothetical protein